MQKKLLDFASQIGLPLTGEQADMLLQYAGRVWQKKEVLNLTSAATLEEVLLRHICDGLQGAQCILHQAQEKNLSAFSVIDAGAGAGYIGITLAIALPQANVILVESIEKRCAFMNWVVLSQGLKNAQIKNTRLGEGKNIQADFVTERAMGKLPDILGICLQAVKPGGIFMAYQGEQVAQLDACPEKYQATCLTTLDYRLLSDNKVRHLMLFEKEPA